MKEMLLLLSPFTEVETRAQRGQATCPGRQRACWQCEKLHPGSRTICSLCTQPPCRAVQPPPPPLISSPVIANTRFLWLARSDFSLLAVVCGYITVAILFFYVVLRTSQLKTCLNLKTIFPESLLELQDNQLQFVWHLPSVGFRNFIA